MQFHTGYQKPLFLQAIEENTPHVQWSENLGVKHVYEVPCVVGRHVIYEMQDGNPNLLNDEEFIKDALKKAAEDSGATLLSIISHKFEPQGVTAVALLSESHISIHTWPEHGYAAVDAFTCGEHTNPEVACGTLRQAFNSGYGTMKLVRRLGPTPSQRPLQDSAP